MSITVNILYTSTNGQARKFAEEMVERNIVKAIRAEEGNEKYDYSFNNRWSYNIKSTYST